jgi:hypothetical protein
MHQPFAILRVLLLWQTTAVPNHGNNQHHPEYQYQSPPILKNSQHLPFLVWCYVHVKHLCMMSHNPAVFARCPHTKTMSVPVLFRNTKCSVNRLPSSAAMSPFQVLLTQIWITQARRWWSNSSIFVIGPKVCRFKFVWGWWDF